MAASKRAVNALLRACSGAVGPSYTGSSFWVHTGSLGASPAGLVTRAGLSSSAAAATTVIATTGIRGPAAASAAAGIVRGPFAARPVEEVDSGAADSGLSYKSELARAEQAGPAFRPPVWSALRSSADPFSSPIGVGSSEEVEAWLGAGVPPAASAPPPGNAGAALECDSVKRKRKKKMNKHKHKKRLRLQRNKS